MKSVDSSPGVIFVFLSTPDVSKLPVPLFWECQRENVQRVHVVWEKRPCWLRLRSFEPTFTSFLTDDEHLRRAATRVSPAPPCPHPGLRSRRAETFTWVMEDLFSFPFLASVSSPFNDEKMPFLCLPRWVSDSVLFRKAESSLEHT